jgi:hypothetical protein
MRKWRVAWLVAVIGLSLFVVVQSNAQTDSGWSLAEPLGLLQPGNAPSFPEIAGDPFGQVHVVATSNWTDGVDLPNGTVLYTYWDGYRWSTPVDILVSQEGSVTAVHQFASDENGTLYLLWTSLRGGLYLSRSTSLYPDTAQAWDTENLAVQGTGGDIAVQDSQQFAIAYIDNNRHVMFQRTEDGGQTWSVLTKVWSPPADNFAAFTLRLAIDAQGVYHAAWTETAAELNYNPSGVWYARSLDGGASWQDFWYVPDEGSFINIGFDNENNVHLLWNHNVGSKDGRYHAISHDGGQSWSEPQWIFPGLSGRTGYPQTYLDNKGQLHQLTSGHPGLPNSESEIYYTQWLGDHWGDLTTIGDEPLSDGEEGPVVAVVGGNQMYVVWRNNTIMDIMYAAIQLEANEETLTSLNNFSSNDRNEDPLLTQDVVESVDDITANNSPTLSGSRPISRQTTAFPIILISIPALLFIGVVIIWQLKRS